MFRRPGVHLLACLARIGHRLLAAWPIHLLGPPPQVLCLARLARSITSHRPDLPLQAIWQWLPVWLRTRMQLNHIGHMFLNCITHFHVGRSRIVLPRLWLVHIDLCRMRLPALQ